MEYKVVFRKGALVGREFSISASPVMIGRSHKNDIRIPDKSEYQDVSRTHLILSVESDSLTITNLSAQTTRVNGLQMPTSHKLTIADHATVAIGKLTEFMVTRVEAADSPPPAVARREDDLFDVDEADAPLAAGENRQIVTSATSFGSFLEPRRAPTQTDSVQFGRPTMGDTSTGAAVVGLTQATGMVSADVTRETGALRADAATGVSSEGEEIGTGVWESDPEPVSRHLPPVPRSDVTIDVGTVPVSQEEVRRLIEEHHRAASRKAYRRIGLLSFLFIALASAYFFLRPHPETSLTWPLTANGKYDIARFALSLPIGEGMAELVYPQDARAGRPLVDSNGVVVVKSFVGRSRDVPLQIRFACSQSRENLQKSRAKLFDETKRRLEESGGWNFTAVSPTGFIGGDNGIPYQEIQYLRSDKADGITSQWFGYLMLIAYGDLAITVAREVPAVEQWRAGTLLAGEKMVWFAEQAVFGYWEGRPDFRNEPVADMIAEAEGLLSRKAPLLWREVEYLLQSAMIKSGGEGRDFEAAHKKLVKLRTDQKREFNRLKAASRCLKLTEMNKEDVSALEEAMRVFSSPDDRRHALLKRGEWE